MPHQDEWPRRVIFPGDAAQSKHVRHQQVKPALAEISELCGGWSRASVSAMIVSVDRPTGGNQSFNRAGVPPDMFTHTVRNRDHATRGPKAIPPGARYSQSICARKSKLAGRHHMLLSS